MNDRIENTILNSLFFNEDFVRKAIPFIKPHYFSKRDEKILYEQIDKFVNQYKNLPTKESLLIELNDRKDINDEEVKNVKELLNNEGNGKVLVVDANGISTVALLGDMIAEAGVKNNWSGVVINGYVRDIEILKTLDIGVQALGTMPVRSEKKNQGELGVDITFGGVTFSRGNYIYADNNGLLLSKEELELI